MSEPKTLNLDVYLSRWIVEDGNYDDFRVGEMRQFALEFWAPSPLTRTTERTMSLRQQRDHSYSVSGRLVFRADGVWVIDCGVLAYSEQEREIEAGCAVGDFVRGDLKFGVDPFFYFEQHCKIPSIPALIYEWQINSIEQDTTPHILSDVSGSRMHVRDELNAVSRRFPAQIRTLPSRQITGQNLFFATQSSTQNRVTSCSFAR